MATKITKWQAENGSLYNTQAEAENADQINLIADVLYKGGAENDGEFNYEDAAKALIKHFDMSPRVPKD